MVENGCKHKCCSEPVKLGRFPSADFHFLTNFLVSMLGEDNEERK